MTDIPIIFSAPMVQVLRAGRKTMTRRLRWTGRKAADGEGFRESPWARVKPGDRLWVREALKADRMENLLTGERTTNAMVAYYAADDSACVEEAGFNLSWVWKRPILPSMHMPRGFSRLTLIVTAVKIEYLQDISEEDARAEGLGLTKQPARVSFMCLWDSLHGAGAWDANPDVVALTFTVYWQNIDAMEALAA